MSRKSLIEQHDEYVKTINRIDGQYKHLYHGFEKVGILKVMHIDEDVRYINDSDNAKSIRAKNEVLKDLIDNNHRVIAIKGATVQNRFLAEKYVKEADIIQSAQNYEHFKLQTAGSHAMETQRKKDMKTGAIKYVPTGYDIFGAGIDEPEVGIRMAQIFNIKGTDYTVGQRIPKGLSQAKRQAYETWLGNRSQVVYTELSSSQQANKYKALFGGIPYKFDRKERIDQYQKNIIKALTGKKSVKAIINMQGGYLAKGTNLNRLVKEIQSLTPKQFLYLSFKYSDLFTFSYLYSPNDYKDKINELISTIQAFKQRTFKDKKSVEHEQYVKYLKELGTYYD